MIGALARNPALRRALAGTFITSAAGLGFIATHEGEVRKVYIDPVGIPTACVGHTATVTKADVGKPMSAEVCKYLLAQDTKAAERGVARSIRVPITQDQFDALVSFTFNVGTGALHTSTLARKLNAGDCLGAAAEFHRWNKAGGRVLRGLVTRRAEESALFAKDC